MRCHCGCEDIEFDSTRGDAVCTACGSVLEENAIVSEVQFSESATGASSVLGQFVSSSGMKPASRGPGGHLQRQSREITIENGRKRLSQIAATLHLNQHHIEAAQRLYMLAVQRNFTLGRKVQHVCAACLYIVCRREKTPHLLLDFSDVLQTNIYVLGSCFLKFCRLLNVTLPVIDPSLYIHRFASKLNFGDKTHAVAMSALRLVARMSKDWIHTGRRPAGICGAALLISARMHGFERDVADIVNIVRIADLTIKKRLCEFEITPSCGLTVDEFETVELATECDPPAFTKGQTVANDASEDGSQRGAKSRKRHVHDDVNVIAAKGRIAQDQEGTSSERGAAIKAGGTSESNVVHAPVGPGSELAVTADKEPVTTLATSVAQGPVKAFDDPLGIQAMDDNEFQSLENQVQSVMSTEEFQLLERDTARRTDKPIGRPQHLLLTGSSSAPASDTVRGGALEELQSIEQDDDDDAPKAPEDATQGEEEGCDLSLAELDDDEIDSCILKTSEVESRRAIWEALNQSYLDELASRKKKQESTSTGVKHSHRRKRDAADDPNRAAESPYEACVKALKKQKMSSKINYSALEGLFGKKPGDSTSLLT